jgi:hypothetical protein
MPGRAIGVQWFSIARAAHTLKVDLDPPQTMRPNSKFVVPISISELSPIRTRVWSSPRSTSAFSI